MSVRLARALPLLLVGAAACGVGGATGTFSLELVTAPGSTVLDGVTFARLTLSDPYTVVESARGGDGKFHLEMEVEAYGPPAQVTFEGIDAGGSLVVWGRSGVLPLGAFDANVRIYVAAPDTLAAAPVALDPPRTDMGIARFGFGVLMVGGVGAGDVLLDRTEIYDIYAHELIPGDEAPAPRARPVVGAGVTGNAYLFGGRGAEGDTGSVWVFNSNIEPEGAWSQSNDMPEFARSGVSITPVRADAYVITGDPPLVLDGLVDGLAEIQNAPPLSGTATTVQREDVVRAVFAGAGTGTDGLVTLDDSGFTDQLGVAGAARVGHGAVIRRDATVLLLGGSLDGTLDATGFLIDPTASSFMSVGELLATPRSGAAIGGNGEYAIVAGGRDAGGNLLADAEIIDLGTLSRRTTLPLLVPRTGAIAAPLPTGQIMILGGVDAAGAPVGTIEIFTPAAPPALGP